MLGLGTFGGGLIIVPLVGVVRLHDVWRGLYRLIAQRVAIRPWRIAFFLVVFALVVIGALIPLYQALYGVGGVVFERS